jgi:hypothetical protein
LAEISFQAVIDAITLQLRQEFPDAGIFIDTVPQ